MSACRVVSTWSGLDRGGRGMYEWFSGDWKLNVCMRVYEWYVWDYEKRGKGFLSGVRVTVSERVVKCMNGISGLVKT